jgi:acyl transferase domain-containing protein
LLHQALNPLNLPRKVLAAYDDGIRVFVECGPRDLMAQWVKEILGDKEHLVVSLDPRGGMDALSDGLNLLTDAGIELDVAAWNRRIRPEPSPEPENCLLIEARQRAIVFPPREVAELPSARPPELPPAAIPLKFAAPPPMGAKLALAAPHSQPVATERSRQASLAASAAGAPSISAKSQGNPQLAQLTAFHQQVASVHNTFLSHQAEVARLVGVATAGGPQRTRVLPPLSRAAPAKPEVGIVPPTSPAATSPPPASETPSTPQKLSPHKAPVQPSSVSPSKSGAPSERPTHPDALRRDFPGPKFDREQLYLLSTGPLSLVLGDAFKTLDGRKRVVRMPAPPFLLADRVLGIEGEQGSMRAQTHLWTETDIREDAWYLNRGRMPFGILEVYMRHVQEIGDLYFYGIKT